MTTQPEALRLADRLEGRWALHPEMQEIAAELRRLAEVEGEWMALSQDQGKLEGQIDRLQARLAASEDQAERAVAGCERLRAQRDALLEALKDLMQQYKDQPECFMDWSKARAAIKAVEGETK